MITYTILVHDEEGGGYWAEVEELPGCFGSGATLEAVEPDIKEAIEFYINSLRARGVAVPEGKACSDADQSVWRWEIAVA